MLGKPYPVRSDARTRWILERRPPRAAPDPWKPHAFQVEEERAESGEVVPVATIFLTNRECPWRCLMCDLWKTTLEGDTPPGAIPVQIDFALQELERTAAASPRQLKLYNSGSFFDPRAVPVSDRPAVAERSRRFERVIVECHPALVNDAVPRFRDLLEGRPLEVAMGLETAHPEVLEKLNKRMNLEDFTRAATFLRDHHLALRVFILVQPPFLAEEEAIHWAKESIDFAFRCGASVVSLIPVRAGNGALEALAARGEFAPPKLATLEAALDYGVSRRRGRAFADLWDLEKFSDCPACFAARRDRLREINLTQKTRPRPLCPQCGEPGNAR